MISPECDEKKDLNYENLDEIILYNDKIKHSLNIIKSQIDNIIDTSSNNSLKIKLKAIKYNKNLRNKFYIKLINYKFYSGKYIIYESNGIRKEYNGYDDTLRFEGEYLNGERNGKGKEYDMHGTLIFEGEYLNDLKLNGKGKEKEGQ